MFANMASTAAGVAVGSTIGHTLGAGISSIFGGGRHEPQTVQPQEQMQQQQQPDVCGNDQRAFMKCLETNSNDITSCQFYLDMLKQCQSASKSY